MNAIAYDTLSASKRLQEQGFNHEDAEAIVNEINAAREHNVENLVTKSDLKAAIATLRAEMVDLNQSTIKWMFAGYAAVIALCITILMKISG